LSAKVQGIVLFAHGARDPAWARPFEAIRDLVRAARPDARVELAFLELMQPALPEAVNAIAASGVREILVFPLFMAQGGHLKKDLPVIVEGLRNAHPQVRIGIEPAVGEVPEVLDAISAWILDTAGPGP
jgi:sirohydrochlorin cobaltochelatase